VRADRRDLEQQADVESGALLGDGYIAQLPLGGAGGERFDEMCNTLSAPRGRRRPLGPDSGEKRATTIDREPRRRRLAAHVVTVTAKRHRPERPDADHVTLAQEPAAADALTPPAPQRLPADALPGQEHGDGVDDVR